MQPIPENQRERRYRHTLIVLQSLLTLLIIGMLVTAGVSLFGGGGLLYRPTPTLTATPGPPRTPTPDFRARLIAEDRATQAAYNTLVAASNGAISPLGRPTTAVTAEPTSTVMLPIIVGDSATATATAGAVAVEPTAVLWIPGVGNSGGGDSPLPTATPNPEAPPAGESPLPPPDQGGPPPAEAIPTPTETPTEIPTETPTATVDQPTATPTATATPFIVGSLRAFVTVTPGATTYTGPSTQYTVTTPLVYNQEIILYSRDETGEWVTACCIANSSQYYWVRQAQVPPRDNQLQPGAPSGAGANDVRWLAVLPAPPTTEPILTPTAIPNDLFVFSRVRRGNNARLTGLPKPALQTEWFTPFQATSSMNTPVLVSGGYVVVGSEDNHLYALDRTYGNQQRSFNINLPIQAGPLAQDGLIYFITVNGLAYALNSELQQIWQSTMTGPPITQLYLAGNRLYVGVQEGDAKRLLKIDRINGGTVFAERYQFVDGQPLNALAIGNQLLYIGDPIPRAIDINKLTQVWQQDGVSRLTAPPVYITPGDQALAELYVADDQNRLHLLDANTGRIIWTVTVNQRLTGLAVGADAIYGSGGGFVLAWSRRNPAFLWQRDVPGAVRSGPIISDNQIFVVTDAGYLRMFDLNGLEIASTNLPGGVQVPANGAPAVSGIYLYVPGSDGKVYAFRGEP